MARYLQLLNRKPVSGLRGANRRRGMLTLEWVLIITVVVIGIIGGLGAVRNATIGELSDLAEAIESLNVKTAAEAEAEGISGSTPTEATAEGS